MLRIIRITRLVKIARLARVLRFIMALRTLSPDRRDIRAWEMCPLQPEAPSQKYEPSVSHVQTFFWGVGESIRFSRDGF